MRFIDKIAAFKADGLDVGLIKISVFFATLWLAKIWPSILGLEWYWYLVIWVLAAIRPFVTVYQWLVKPG